MIIIIIYYNYYCVYCYIPHAGTRKEILSTLSLHCMASQSWITLICIFKQGLHLPTKCKIIVRSSDILWR